jgi:predicted MFS family arabinose efflux permease
VSSDLPRKFLVNFLLLSLLSGLTIGMGKVVTTFYALHIGANSVHLGLIAGAESLGRILVTLPAGFMISRYGAKAIYSVASLGPMVLNLLIPWVGSWYLLALIRGLSSVSVPFRAISMNSSFLQRLRTMGVAKAGWYRGSQSLGTAVLGPMLGSFFVVHGAFLMGYVLLSLCFAAMAVFGRSFLPESEAADSAEQANVGGVLTQLRELLRNPDVAESCVVEFITSIATSIYTTFIIVVALTVARLPESQAVALMLVQGVTSVAALFGFGYVLNFSTRMQTQAWSFVLAIGGLALLGLGHTLSVLALGTVLLSCGSALLHLVKMAQLGALNVSKSKISSLYNLVGLLGTLVGATLGGLLSASAGLQHLFLGCIPLLVGTWIFCGRRHRTSAREAQ